MSDDDVKTVYEDTPTAEEGAAVADQGLGVSPLPIDAEEAEDDPKSAGTPVHPAPTAEDSGDDSADDDADDSADDSADDADA